jgi:hypothetical protein
VEALTRLGAPIPEPLPIPVKEQAGSASTAAPGEEPGESVPHLAFDISMESGSAEAHVGNGLQPTIIRAAESAEESSSPSAPTGPPGAVKRRRRGRRGGRKRHGHSGAGLPIAGDAASPRPAAPAPGRASPQSFSETGTGEATSERFSSGEPSAEPVVRSFEPAAETRPAPPRGGSVGSAWQGGSSGPVSSRSRAGDPGLSSRIAQLESQLRRMLSCPMSTLDEAEQAPAGPGVLLLSDSDQVTHYYIEACQTLRIGIGNLLRGSRGARGGAQLKPSVAEHLGINESRVAKYMKDNCVVRWIQLDEGAAELAHFAIAVLRPVVAE